MAATHHSQQQRRRYSIGYALRHKKQQSFIRDSLINLAANRWIDLIKIDTDSPLIHQGPPFDCILHKLHGQDWKQQLVEYKTHRNPNVVILDAPEAIERLHNRISMLQVVSELNISSCDGVNTFGIPEQIVINDFEALKSLEGIKFPMIAKPLVADGSAKSHKMSLVYNNEGLSNLKPPIVLQQFVNHGGVIFKVYVVGEYVKCVKRKSLPDVSEEKLKSLGGLKAFSLVSNLAKNEMNDEVYCKMMELDECVMPPLEFIADIAKGLRDALKLNLFNFDVIRDTRIGNRYLVVDINYFPGYAKMPAYESVMTEFFWNVLVKNERRVEGIEAKDEECDERKLVDNNGFVMED